MLFLSFVPSPAWTFKQSKTLAARDEHTRPFPAPVRDQLFTMLARSHVRRVLSSLSTGRMFSSSAKTLPNLQLKNKIETIKREGSFIKELFFRCVDPKMLTFPRVIIEQEEIDVMSTVPDILREDYNALKYIGDRSTTEIAIIFEAAGRLGIPDITEYIRYIMSQYVLHQVKRPVDLDCNIAYGYTERHEKMGALPVSEWDSTATYDASSQTWHLKGCKTMLPDQPYDKYLVFCKNYQIDIEGWPDDRPKLPGYGAFLLDKKDVTTSSVKLGEFNFQQIGFDVSLPEDCVIFLPSIERNEIFKSKALGHLAVSAWMVGVLKQFYKYTSERKELQYSYAINLYALESLVYWAAGLMDSYESTDFELEGLALKSNCIDLAQECFWLLQQCNTSRRKDFGPIGPLNDSIALADLFFESTDRAKMLLGLEGLAYYGSIEHDYVHKLSLAPLYPMVAMKHLHRFILRKFKRNTARVRIYFDEANFKHGELIEELINRNSQATEHLMMVFAKEVSYNQLHVMRLGHVAALIVKMLANYCRGDMAIRNELEGWDHEIIISNAVIRTTHEKATPLINKMASSRMDSGDAAVDKVHSRSVRYGGYWAYSPLDKVHY